MFHHLKSTYKYLKRIMNKEVREGEKHLETSSSKDRTLKDLRKRQKSVETARVRQVKKSMEAKKAKKKHPHRLRSTPGEVSGECEATPSYTHKEGSRWMKNTQNKIRNNTKIFTKHKNKGPKSY